MDVLSLPAALSGGMHMDEEDKKKIVIKAHEIIVRLYCLCSNRPASRIKERENRQEGRKFLT